MNLLSIGYSRIFDFQHHWYDALVGGIVGSLIAFVTFKFILNWRHYDPKFLPYTATATGTKPLVTQNGAQNGRRVSPTPGYDQTANF